MSMMDKVGDWIDELARATETRTGTDIGKLLSFCLGRVVLKECMGAGAFEPARYERVVPHIVDWLVSSKLRDEDWLARLDANGRPLKLMKFGTVAAISAEADKAMQKRRNEGLPVAANQEGEITEAELSDGWRVVRLTTVESLDRESAMMGHCVGNGAYDEGLQNRSIQIFSIRDRWDKSHITVEVTPLGHAIRQVQGKGNVSPCAEYMGKLNEWQHGFGFERLALPDGYLAARSGRIVDIATLVPGDVFDGDVAIYVNHGDTIPFPDGVSIEGDLEIVAASVGPEGYCHPGLPPGLEVSGELKLRRMVVDHDRLPGSGIMIGSCQIRRLPKQVEAQCEFSASVFVEGALSDTCFEGHVRVSYCSGAVIGPSTSFLGGLTVSALGDTEMRFKFENGSRMESPLTVRSATVEFGQEFSSASDMMISGGDKSVLPTNMVIDGDLIVINSDLKNWPRELFVGGMLDTENVKAAGRQVRDTDNPKLDRRIEQFGRRKTPQNGRSVGMRP